MERLSTPLIPWLSAFYFTTLRVMSRRRGFTADGRLYAPPERVRARAEAIHRLAPNKMKVILRQGLKRQIRLMFLAVGYEVKHLQRVRMGNLKLGKLRVGEWRYLEDREVAALRGQETAKQRK